ncbi:hypothetical protein [Martelella mediterranea]|uniref:VCBS repeat-containing protein n=1 Tax=Martelella mediterranea TaxID=293089 RepID=A0A4R3NKZ3_9HYPH|nr:hypothetical protein [Martelella mediterranea]TCT34797.1 VCBS repeat-containing protein [Martelella mediterranea]
MRLKYLSIALLISASAATAQDWADPDHPEIDYSGVYGQLASENGYKEMMGWWSYGDDSKGYDDIDQLVVAANEYQLMNEHKHWTLAGECLDGTLIVALNHDVSAAPRTFAVADDGFIDVNYTVDGKHRYEEGWVESMAGTRAALYNEDAYTILKDFAETSEVVFEVTSADGTANELKFDLTGSEEALPRLFAECGL